MPPAPTPEPVAEEPVEPVEPEVPEPVVPDVPPLDPMPDVVPPLPLVVPGEVEPLLVPALVPVVDWVEPGDWLPPPPLSQATSARGASKTRTPAMRRPDVKLEVIVMVFT